MINLINSLKKAELDIDNVIKLVRLDDVGTDEEYDELSEASRKEAMAIEHNLFESYKSIKELRLKVSQEFVDNGFDDYLTDLWDVNIIKDVYEKFKG
jgi:hypothetical protein